PQLGRVAGAVEDGLDRGGHRRQREQVGDGGRGQEQQQQETPAIHERLLGERGFRHDAGGPATARNSRSSGGGPAAGAPPAARSRTRATPPRWRSTARSHRRSRASVPWLEKSIADPAAARARNSSFASSALPASKPSSASSHSSTGGGCTVPAANDSFLRMPWEN